MSGEKGAIGAVLGANLSDLSRRWGTRNIGEAVGSVNMRRTSVAYLDSRKQRLMIFSLGRSPSGLGSPPTDFGLSIRLLPHLSGFHLSIGIATSAAHSFYGSDDSIQFRRLHTIK